MSGYDELRSGAAFLDLSTRGKLKLIGEDRARLLHAMCSNDIEHLAAGQGVYAFFLSAQGRILADANIFNIVGNSLWIDTEPENSATLAAHLDKYIIADDVTIEDLTQTWAAIGVEGPEAAAAAARAGVPVPADPLGSEPFEDGFAARLPSAATDGIRLFVPVAKHAEIVGRLLASGILEATAQEANTVRLENKRPLYGQDISDRNLVHETQQLHGVHFSKGCYIGQEIVERVRSRGQVHRLLTAVSITGSQPPPPGTKIFGDSKEVGEVTSSAWSPALHQVVGFAYLRGEGLDPANKLTIDVDSIPQQASIRL